MTTIGLQDEKIRRDVFEAMQTDSPPYKTYKKTILARVNVRILDPIRMIPAELILSGDPNEAPLEDITVKVWTPQEDVYLKRNNRIHLENGTLIPFTGEERQVSTVNQISDEEIEYILAQPFFALKNKLTEFTSPVPVRRFLLAAEKLNRPVKTVQYIQSVLSEMEQDVETKSTIVMEV